MNSRLRNIPVISLALILVLAVVAYIAFSQTRPAPVEGNLTGASVGGPFTLIDETGQTVTSDTYAGQWRLMYFGFTYCPDVCPTDTAALAAGLKAFEAKEPARAEKVQPLFVSFDTERDTPEILAEFTDHFHPRLIGLTGTPEQVQAALETFRIYASKTPGATEGSYSYDHVAIIYLMDPDGMPVEFVVQPTAEKVEAMLLRFVA
ncbi:MAG: SCO family protein [Sphingomonadaceae bacterium]